MKLSDIKNDKIRLEVIKIIQNQDVCIALKFLADAGFSIKSMLFRHLYNEIGAYPEDATDLIMDYLEKN